MQGMNRLLELQDIDLKLDRLRLRRTALESGGTLAAARAEADAAERTLGDLRLRIDEMARDQGRFEHEVDSLQQKETAENTRMFDGSIANAKELEAMQDEIDNLKKRRSDREDELLALMEQCDELERSAAEAEATSTRLRATLEEGTVEAEH